MSELKKYCPRCSCRHVLSPTYDGERKVVGYFCNRTKLLAKAGAPRWNGEDIRPHVTAFVSERVDLGALNRMHTSRIPALAKRIAFQLLQTEWAKRRRLNYAFAHYWIEAEILNVKGNATTTKAGR